MIGIDQILLFIFGLLSVAMAAFLVWEKYQAHYQKEHLQQDAPILRGRAILHHPEFGILEIVSYQPESATHGRYFGLDHTGMKYSWIGHEEEFKPRNIVQVLLGPGNPEFDYVPKHRAQELASRYAQTASDVDKMIEYKEKFEQANVDAKLSRVQEDQRVDKMIEQMQSLNRSKQQQLGAKR